MATHEKIHRDTVEYWRTVTADNQPIDSRHPVPKLDVLSKYLSALNPVAGQRVLDIGISFGRFVPLYLSLGLEIYGVDVDPLMISALRESFPGEALEVRHDRAEELSFADDMFDFVVCWGVFDELDQGPALAEIARVLKNGGQLLFTGKNSNYHIDDKEAIVAEVAARSKKHPNYFTDLAAIDFDKFGLRVDMLTTFARRGDFAAGRSTTISDLNAPFYEYLAIMRKMHLPEYDRRSAPAISRNLSLTLAANSPSNRSNDVTR
ncbi:MAG: class I SAM-dependent methyltransferase [Candidatus Binatia bacterium]